MRVVFIGSKSLGLEIIKKTYLLNPKTLVGVVTLNDKKDSRSVLKEIEKFCHTKNIPTYVITHKKHFRTAISELKPDFCIVACWYLIIEKDIINSVSYGFIGVHHSDLPRYRGGSPLVWQLINGERVATSSIFSLNEEMDAGPIWGKVFTTIEENDYIDDITNKLENKVLDWFDQNYLKILNHDIKPKPQLTENISYCAQRFPLDGKIDWKKSAKDIYNFIRAQSEPYPGAFTYYKDKKLIVWSAEPRNVVYYGTPGQVARIDKSGTWVICGDNKPLILRTVQLEGNKKKPSNEILKSFRIRLGK